MLIKENIVVITLKKYNDSNCSNLLGNTLYKYKCDFDSDISICCREKILRYFNNIKQNTSYIGQDICYNGNYILECGLDSSRYYLYFYVLCALLFIINSIVIFFTVCYINKYRKHTI